MFCVRLTSATCPNTFSVSFVLCSLSQLSPLFNACYIRPLRLVISLHLQSLLHPSSSAVAVPDTITIIMSSGVAIFTDLLAAYNEIGTAMTIVLHRL